MGAEASSSDTSDVELDGLSEDEGRRVSRRPQPGNVPHLSHQVGSNLASRRSTSLKADAGAERPGQERQAVPMQQSQAELQQERQAGMAWRRQAGLVREKTGWPSAAKPG